MASPYPRATLLLPAAAVLAGCSAPPLGPSGDVSLPGTPGRVLAQATFRQPAAPGTAKVVAVSCPAGTTLSGGGISAALIGGGKPPSSLHVDGTTPASSRWVGVSATGGQLVVGAAITAYSVCLRGTPFGRAELVERVVPGPDIAATTARATVTCLAGQRALGGGGLAAVTGGATSPSLRLIASYPSDPHGAPTSANPAAWTAVADAGGRTGSGVETRALVLCVHATGLRTVVARASRPGPTSPGAATAVTAACPGATKLLAGGARTGPRSGGAPQQGLHLTGSFPSARQEAWTARAEAGGQGSPNGTDTTAFAVCLGRA